MLARETGLSLRILRLLGGVAGGWTPIGQVAAKLDLSRAHAGKLCHRLQRAGYLDTRQGVRGGVALTDSARAATLFDLVSDLADPFLEPHCILLREACVPDEPCPLHDAWSALHEQVLVHLRACPISAPAGQETDWFTR